MNEEQLWARYQELQRYVGWTAGDTARIAKAAPLLKDSIAAIVDDFYDELERHAEAVAVLTGGPAQVARLKRTLRLWLEELLAGPYDQAYVARRGRVGLRHVEIGLAQVYTNVALARLRGALISALNATWLGDPAELTPTIQSLNKLLDLDLATIAVVYEAEYVRREQAAERSKLESALLQSERLAAIGQMATGLAHEARNALQRIQACSEMLELEVEGKPSAVDLVRRIQHAQSDVFKLFDEVRGYAAPIHLELSRCAAPNLWRQAWQMLAPQYAARDVHFEERLEAEQLDFCVDHFRLIQVFRNLFENSLAACKDPVSIVVTCEAAQLGEKDALRIVVADNGPGLNSEQCLRIFQPFYTTKTKGTGLGMAIAERIVNAQGGVIVAGNGAAGGAEIALLLPRNLP